MPLLEKTMPAVKTEVFGDVWTFYPTFEHYERALKDVVDQHNGNIIGAPTPEQFPCFMQTEFGCDKAVTCIILTLGDIDNLAVTGKAAQEEYIAWKREHDAMVEIGNEWLNSLSTNRLKAIRDRSYKNNGHFELPPPHRGYVTIHQIREVMNTREHLPKKKRKG